MNTYEKQGVRVEFKREKVYEPSKVVEHHTYHHHSWPYVYPRPYSWPYYEPWNFCGTLNQNTSGSGSLVSQSSSLAAQCSAGVTRSASASSASGPIAAMNVISQSKGERGSLLMGFNDVGITVDGSISNQKFVPVAGFECEASEVIVLHLIGRKAQALVKVAKTVDHKPVCDTCGKTNKGTAKFCIECGTSLEKV